MRLEPQLQRDELDVVGVLPGREVAGLELGAVGPFEPLALPRRRLGGEAGEAVVAGLGQARAPVALAIHKELREVPLTLGDLRQVERPAGLAAHRTGAPARKAAATREAHGLAGVGGVGDRTGGGAGVVRAEAERLGEVVSAAAQEYAHGAGERAAGLERAHRGGGGGEGGEGPCAPARRRVWRRAAPAVVATGRDEEELRCWPARAPGLVGRHGLTPLRRRMCQAAPVSSAGRRQRRQRSRAKRTRQWFDGEGAGG